MGSMKKLNLSLIISCLLTLVPVTAWAALMSSTNFQIISDAVAVGGGLSTSTNYNILDTLNAEMQAATSTSANFIEASGFQNVKASDTLSVSFSKTSISLGTLSRTSVASDSQIITVSTNSTHGYTTTIQADGGLRAGSNVIQAASGSITAGTEGYGVKTTGTNGQLSSITALAISTQTLARATAPVSGNAITITYEATISGATPPGDYSQTITFTTTANF